MTDSISFTASGEMDNGFTVSTTLELDGSALDDRSISIDTGDMGKLTFCSVLGPIEHGMM